MKITGKRSWITKARKSDTYQGDRDDKQLLIDLMMRVFGVACIRPEPIFDFFQRPFYPDVRTTNYNPVTYFEMNGPYHNDVDDSRLYDQKKRAKYLSAKVPVLYFWSDKNGVYDEDNIVEVCEKHGFVSKQKI